MQHKLKNTQTMKERKNHTRTQPKPNTHGREKIWNDNQGWKNRWIGSIVIYILMDHIKIIH